MFQGPTGQATGAKPSGDGGEITGEEVQEKSGGVKGQEQFPPGIIRPVTSEMSSTEGSSEAPPMSDSSLDTMLSAAVVARERTSEDNSSSDVSDSVRQGLAGDFTDSSESDFVGQSPAVPQPSGHVSGPEQARIWGSSEELLLSRGGAAPPAERGGLVTVPPSPAALTGSAAAQARPARGLQPTAPPRPSGSALTSPARST